MNFESAQLMADVQSFVSNPTQNFGWVLKADNETTGARVYTTREGSTATRPTLVVTFDTALGNSFCGPAVPNQSGASATIAASGSPVVADNSLTLTASNLPPQVFGFFIASQMDGLVMNPGGSFGNLCLSGSLGRFQMQIQDSGPTGVISIPVDLTAIPQPNNTVPVNAGETYYFQAWFRDSQAGMAGSNFTDGFRIDFL